MRKPGPPEGRRIQHEGVARGGHRVREQAKGEGTAKAAVAVAKGESLPEPGVMSSNDRRFLRSLRIAADEVSQQAE